VKSWLAQEDPVNKIPAPRAEADNSTPPLIYRDVSKSYQGHFYQQPVSSLVGLNLELRQGEILGLLGPNGAGKTTTIKLALGLVFPDCGEVRLMGVGAGVPRARAKVGYLPENPYFPDDLSGRELLELAGRLHGVPAAEGKVRTRELLDWVGLAGAADRLLRTYS
jgi:ABC-2 type transport system ATP-binding protein